MMGVVGWRRRGIAEFGRGRAVGARLGRCPDRGCQGCRSCQGWGAAGCSGVWGYRDRGDPGFGRFHSQGVPGFRGYRGLGMPWPAGTEVRGVPWLRSAGLWGHTRIQGVPGFVGSLSRGVPWSEGTRLWGCPGRGYLALHIAQHQLLVLDFQDDILPPDPSLLLQVLQAPQTILGAAEVPVQVHREQVLGGGHGTGVTGTPWRGWGGAGHSEGASTSTWCWKSFWSLSSVCP